MWQRVSHVCVANLWMAWPNYCTKIIVPGCVRRSVHPKCRLPIRMWRIRVVTHKFVVFLQLPAASSLFLSLRSRRCALCPHRTRRTLLLLRCKDLRRCQHCSLTLRRLATCRHRRRRIIPPCSNRLHSRHSRTRRL